MPKWKAEANARAKGLPVKKKDDEETVQKKNVQSSSATQRKQEAQNQKMYGNREGVVQRTPASRLSTQERQNQKTYGNTEGRLPKRTTSTSMPAQRTQPVTAADRRRQAGQEQKTYSGITTPEQRKSLWNEVKTETRKSVRDSVKAYQETYSGRRTAAERDADRSEHYTWTNRNSATRQTAESSLGKIIGGYMKALGDDSNELSEYKTKLDHMVSMGELTQDEADKKYQSLIDSSPKFQRMKDWENSKSHKFFSNLYKKGEEVYNEAQAQGEKAMEGAGTLKKAYLGAVDSGIGMAVDSAFGPAWFASMIARTYGGERGTVEALGGTEWQDRQYAGLQALKETATEYMFQGAGIARMATRGAHGISLADRVSNKILSKYEGKAADILASGMNLATGVGEENLEEVAGWLLDPVIANTSYANELWERDSRMNLRKQGDDLNKYVGSLDPASVESVKNYLMSDDFTEKMAKDYIDSGASEEDAYEVADLMKEYLVASMTGDKAAEEELEEVLLDKLAGENPYAKSLSKDELADTLLSTTLLTATTGLPGAVSTSQMGHQIFDSPEVRSRFGKDAVKMVAEEVMNSSDEKAAGKAELMKNRLDTGKDITGTEKFQLYQSYVEKVEETAKKQKVAVDTAAVQMRRNNYINPFSYDETGRIDRNTREDYEYYQAGDETQKQYETNFISAHKTAEDIINKNESISETDVQRVNQISSAVAAVKDGGVTIGDAHEFALGNDLARATLKAETGIDLAQYIVYNKDGSINRAKTNEATENAIFRIASENLVKTAKAETEAFIDHRKGEIDTDMLSRFDSKGQSAWQEISQGLDPRNTTQYLATGNAVSFMYAAGRNSGLSLAEVKETLGKNFKMIDPSVLDKAFTAGREDKIDADTPAFGQEVTAGTALSDVDVTSLPVGQLTIDQDIIQSVPDSDYQIYKALAEATGTNIHLASHLDIKDENGNVIGQANGTSDKNNTITLNLNADAERNLGYVFMHEMTHQIKQYAPKEYQKLENLIRDTWFEKDYAGMQRAIKHKIDLYAANNKTLTEAMAMEEIVCDAMAEAIDDPNFAFAICNEDIGTGRAILNSIKTALRSLRQMIANKWVQNKRFHESLLSYLDILSEAEHIWIHALHEATKVKALQTMDAQQRKIDNIDEIQHSLSDDVMTVDKGKARWTEDRIDYIIRDNQEKGTNKTYAYATMMSPRSFLKLTLSDQYLPLWNEAAENRPEEIRGMSYAEADEYVWNKYQETGKWIHDNENYPLDAEELKGERTTPFLKIIQMGDAAHVDGHEGRHRMRALMEAGVESVPVLITTSSSTEKTMKPFMSLRSQEYGPPGPINGGATITVTDLVPVTESYRHELSDRFGGEADVQFSISATNDVLADRDDTAIFIKNTDKANYIDMIFSEDPETRKTEETRPRRTLDKYIGKEVMVTDGKKVYGTIVLGEPHRYTAEEFRSTEAQMKHRVPVDDEYDSKDGKWAYPIESATKYDEPRVLSKDTDYLSNRQARQVKYSIPDTDSTGNSLSEGQKSFFKDSKAVDKNGNLLVLYHSTPEEFTVFDKGEYGSNTGHDNTAYGTFVTDFLPFSERFGENTMTLYANITNPIIHPYGASMKYKDAAVLEEITRTWLETTDPEQFDYYEEMKEEDPDLTLYDYYNDMFTPGDSPYEAADYERELIENAGYDAIELFEGYQKELSEDQKTGDEDTPVTTYAVFNSNQLKRTDNLNPTEDDDVRYSISSLSEAAGLTFSKKDGVTILKDKDGNVITSEMMTPEYLKKTPLGRLLTLSNKRPGYNVMSDAAVDNRLDFLSKLFKMIIDTQDIDLIWAVSGTLGYDPQHLVDEFTPADKIKEKKSKFASITGNSDPQYKSTIDFTTICVKTQAVIDAMSELMKRLHRGLTEHEIIDIVYNETHLAGEQVPCPVCYVFSRWVGLGELFGKIKQYQEHYDENADMDAVRAEYHDLEAKVAEMAASLGIKGGKAKEKLYRETLDRKDELDELAHYNKITEEEKEELKQIERRLDVLDHWSWLGKTRLDPDYKPVPDEILFDINAGREFATEYPAVWKFRTTRGPSLGKAAAPYTPSRLGDTIRGIASPGALKDIGMGNRQLLAKNLSKSAKTMFDRAVMNAKRQNRLNGQRLQSTSDFRFEYALDYILSFIELEAIGAKAQMYTKVPEAVKFLASTNAEVNCSIMPLGRGVDADGNLIFSDVTGMAWEDALALSKAYDNVQPILVAIGRDHLIAAMAHDDITFIIPYHASGSSEKRYLSMMQTVGETVEDRTDFAAYESEHEIEDATDEQKAARNLRIDILTGKAETLDEDQQKILKGNEILRQLYIRIYGKDENGNEAKPDKKYVENFDENGNDADCLGIYLTKEQAKVMMPYEYWDKTSTIKEADAQGKVYQDYCKSLGLTPVFSGWDSNGRYREDRDFTQFPGYWKTLPDRCMYNNDGTYHKQQAINLDKVDLDVLDSEAMRKEVHKPLRVNDPAKTNEIVEKALRRIEAGDTQMSISKQYDKPYMDAVNSGNMEEAQRLVDEAGKFAGFGTRLYHGTREFGFTQIKTEGLESKSDGGYYDWSPFFATDSLEVAQTYSSQDAVKRISESSEPFDEDAFDKEYDDAVNDLISRINSFAGIYNYMDYSVNPFLAALKELQETSHSVDDIIGELEDYNVSEIISDIAWMKANDEAEANPDENKDVSYYADEIQESPEADAIWVRFNIVADMLRAYYAATDGGAAFGNYELLTNTDNFMQVDAKDHRWNDIPYEDEEQRGYYRTRELAVIARDKGYDGIQIANLYDDGGKGQGKRQTKPATIYIFFKPESQVRSADPVTYAEDGSVIPLSERFDPASDDIRYSLPSTDSTGKILTDGQMEYFKNSQARDSQGRLVPVYHTTNRGGFTIFDPKYSDDRRSLFFSSSYDVSQTYGDRATSKINIYEDANNLSSEDLIARVNSSTAWNIDRIATEEDFEYEIKRVTLTEDDIKTYKLSQDYLDNSKKRVATLEDMLARMRAGEDFFYTEYNTIGHSYGANSSIATREEVEKLLQDYGKGTSGYYECYLNFENPLIVDAKGAGWRSIPYGYGDGGSIRDDAMLHFRNISITHRQDEVQISIKGEIKKNGKNGWWEDYNVTIPFEDDNRLKVWLGSTLLLDDDYIYDVLEWSDENGDVEYSSNDYIGWNGDILFEEDYGTVSTRDLAEIAQSEGYDGVIIRNCQDIGGASRLAQGADPVSDIYIAFDSRQIKDVNNENPTDDPDIRFSIPEQSEVMAMAVTEAKTTDDLWFENPVLEEGRVRMSISEDDFLRKINGTWNEREQTFGMVLDINNEAVKNDVRNLVRMVMMNSEVDKQYDADVAEKATNAAKALFFMMRSGQKNNSAQYAWEAAKDIVENAEYIDDEMYQKYKGVLSYISDTKINVPEALAEDGEFIQFATERFGEVMLIKGGEPVSNVYEHLTKSWPKLFPKKVDNEVDQLLVIADVMDEIQPYRIAYSSDEAASLIDQVATALMDIATNGEAYRSAADILKPEFDAKTKAMKARHREAMAKAKENIRTEEKAKRQRQKERADKWKQRLIDYKAKQKERAAERKARKEHVKAFGHIFDNYKTLCKWVLNPSKDHYIPEEFRKTVADLLQTLDLQTENSKALEEKTGKMSQPTFKLYALQAKLSELASKKTEDEAAMFEIDNILPYLLNSLAEKMDGQPIDSLDQTDIRTIDILLAAIVQNVKRVNNIRREEEAVAVSEIGHAIKDDMDKKIARDGEFKSRDQGAIGFVDNIVNMSELTPVYFFERMGALNGMYMELRRAGFDRYVRNEAMIIERLKTILEPYYKDPGKKHPRPGSTLEEWRDDRSAQTVTLSNGKSVRLTAAQMMSLYCLSNRTQAVQHMERGGIYITPIQTSSKSEQRKERRKGKTESGQRAILTREDMIMIRDMLTPEQKKVADALQQLMVTDMARLGNEAHRELYGYEIFDEPDYFPIKSYGNEIATDINNIDQAFQKVKSFGPAKPLDTRASNIIEVDDIFSVVADHCNGMNLYNSYLIPISDFMKVLNYKGIDENTGDTFTVKDKIERAYGKRALTYINAFMSDINGIKPAHRGGLDDSINSLLGKAKKTAVFGNIRVALQQPTAIARALAEIDLQYFKGVGPSKKAMQEMFEHCPIAYWKSLGYYDTYMGRDLEDVMMNNWSRSDVALSGMYGYLDNITWSWIWEAVKNEVEEKQPALEKGSPAYWEACNRRASEVFDKTQVVDSTFHRSHDMRNKSTAVKMLTAFMSEPTLTLNVFRAGMVKAHDLKREGNKAEASKVFGKTMKVIILQAVLVSAVQALADTWRGKDPGLPWGDDDDDEEKQNLWTRFMANFMNDLFDSLHLWNNIYLVKDITPLMDYAFSKATDYAGFPEWFRALMGWDVEYLYGNSNLVYQAGENMAKGIGKIFDNLEKGETDLEKWYDTMQKLASGVGTLWGFPAGTIMRDLKPILKKIVLTASAADGSEEPKVSEKKKSSKSKSKDKKKKNPRKSLFGERYTDAEMEQMEFDEKTEAIRSKYEDLTGEEKTKKIWSAVTTYIKDQNGGKGLSDLVADGDYLKIAKYKKMYTDAGGDEDYFDQRVFDLSKSAMKKTLVYNASQSQLAHQSSIQNYLLSHGMTEEELSGMVYDSDLRKDMQAAFIIGDKDLMDETLLTLVNAGITYDDLVRMWDNRYRMSIETYKKNGRYKDYFKSTGKFIWPTQGTVTSEYGRRSAPTAGASSFHQAIDIGAPQGTPVVAADGGTVISAGANGGYGNSVGIKHDNGMITWYNHLYSWNVHVGDTVAQGQQIAEVGSTGISTGPHLDFKMVDRNGKTVNPRKYLKG